MQTEEMERTVTMLPKPVVEEIDKAAVEQGLSRSGLIRMVMMRYLQERGEKAAKKAAEEWASTHPPESV